MRFLNTSVGLLLLCASCDVSGLQRVPRPAVDAGRVLDSGVLDAGSTSDAGPRPDAGSDDTIPPGPVRDFIVRTGDGHGELTATWRNPDDMDFAGVAFRFSRDGEYPMDLTDGMALPATSSAATSAVWTELDPGSTYYVSAFTFDQRSNYGAGEPAANGAQPRNEAGTTQWVQSLARDFGLGVATDLRITAHGESIMLKSHPTFQQDPVDLDLGEDLADGPLYPFAVQWKDGSYRLYFVYDSQGQRQLAVKVSPDGLTQWGPRIDLGIPVTQPSEPFVYMMPNGRVRLFFTATATSIGMGTLAYSDSQDGLTSWSDAQSLDLGQSVSTSASLLDISGGSTRLYHTSILDGRSQIYVSTSTDGLNSWSRASFIELAGGDNRQHVWPLVVPLTDDTFRFYLGGRTIGRTHYGQTTRGTPDGLTNFSSSIGSGYGGDIRGYSMLALDDGAFRFYFAELVRPGETKIIYRPAPGRFIGYGTLQSSRLDGGGTGANFTDLSWRADVPEGTSVGLQLRSSSSRGQLQEALWKGPRPGETFYRESPAVPAQEHNGHRYMQYRLVLESTDQTVSPVVHEVSIGIDRLP